MRNKDLLAENSSVNDLRTDNLCADNLCTDDLRGKWQTVFNAEIQRKMWDSKAQRYAGKTVPTPQDNAVLAYLLQSGLRKTDRVLDVGCGAGLYGLGMAPYVQAVAGIDISEKMIEAAKAKARELHCENCSFVCADWAQADLADLGWEQAFDLVFVHMSPAVHDYSSFAKLVRASRRRCVFIVNTRRTDKVLDAMLALAGISGVQEERDRQIPYIFQYLWENGFSPQISYEKEVWQSTYTVEEMTDWCVNRAKLHKNLSAGDEARIAEGVVREARKQGGEGMIREEIAVTAVTFDWLVREQDQKVF